MGGFAVTQHYGLERPTLDMDVLSAVPIDSREQLREIAGKGSPLHRKHKLFVDFVTVAAFPEDYDGRVQPVFQDLWKNLDLKILEVHDLALTKLERNNDRDRGDVKYLAESGFLNPAILRQRYYDEYRIYTMGRTEWHDKTLEIWLRDFFPAAQL